MGKTKNKKRVILVIVFLILLAIYIAVTVRGEYLQALEIGEQYVEVFKQNIKYKVGVALVNFAILYIATYITTRFIKRGLKKFFDDDKKEMPKLPNKSISLILSVIISLISSNFITEKVMLAFNTAWFGVYDPIFNMDVGYYMFQKPFIETIIIYFIALLAIYSIYIAVYYIIVFNKYFEKGIDRATLKKNTFIKQLGVNVILVVLGLAAITLVKVQDIVNSKFLTLSDGTNLYGAGLIEATIKTWGYRIFACIILLAAIMAMINFKKENFKRIMTWICIIPGYLVILFVVMLGFDLIYVNSNELDKEKKYIEKNIEFTKSAYGINVDEIEIENSGTITKDEVNKNQEVINNVNILNEDNVLENLGQYQTNSGYYSYTTTKPEIYNIDGKEKLVYISPREIVSNDTRTYNNKTYEPIVTNAKNKQEYDYPLTSTTSNTNTYEGKAGLKLGFLDRIILGVKEKNLGIAFSGNVTKESRIITTRNIITRAKTIMPYLKYDEEPYMVVTDEGKLVWVLDAYTTSNDYPYSQETIIEYGGLKEKINYIRNSVKVIIDAYDGTTDFYITDKSDPIAIAYSNIYPELFKDGEEIPQDISKHMVYPKYLYNIQAKILERYHNVQPEVLYRADDVWDVAKENTSRTTSAATGTDIEPYYTMVKLTNNNSAQLGLVLPYTIEEKQNITSYLVATCDSQNNKKLTLYKFKTGSSILGTIQLDSLVEQDEKILNELNSLNVTGTKIQKNIIIVPINNTLLYVEPIYQIMLNDKSQVPQLKKVVVASGNKVAIGNNIEEAITNLLSQEAISIEVEAENKDELIKQIINANKNLEESNKSNNWEMIGKDMSKLQQLIEQLQTLVEQDEKKEAEIEKNEPKTNKNQITTNTAVTE